MKALEDFVAANDIDAVAADSLRNLVGESQAILQDIDRQVIAGLNPAEAEVKKAKESERVKAAIVTLVGPVTGAALQAHIFP